MKDRRRGGGDDANRWLTTYGDVVTLLLAFFVLLFAMSEIDNERFEQLVAGFQQPFNNPGRVGVLPRQRVAGRTAGRDGPRSGDDHDAPREGDR